MAERRAGSGVASKLVFVNRYFYPDLSATSQMLTDLAAHLAAAGRAVTVVSSRLGYEDPAARFAARETVLGGVTVLRVATTRFGRARLAGRALDYLSFYAAVFWRLLRVLERGDVVVAKTDPPLLSVVVALAARVKGAVLVNWLQDVFPEVGAALGVRILGGLPGRCLRALRDASLRAAAANVVLGEGMARHLRGRAVAPASVHVIPNWADDREIRPLAHADNPLRHARAWQDKFVVAYSGNLGRAHEADTLLAAARELAGEPRIRFALIGGGARTGAVRAFIEVHGLQNIELLPYQARGALAHSLGAADLHLISLLPEVEGYIVPSKFYGIAAAGRPIAFVGDPDGEIGRLVARFDCGAACRPGDAAALASFIRALAQDPQRAARLGANARAALDRHFSQSRSLQAWTELLAGIAGRDM